MNKNINILLEISRRKLSFNLNHFNILKRIENTKKIVKKMIYYQSST